MDEANAPEATNDTSSPETEGSQLPKKRRRSRRRTVVPYWEVKLCGKAGTVIVVMNHKGGTGKSTSTELMSQFRLKDFPMELSLIVDCDPQTNVTAALGHREDDHKKSIADLCSIRPDWSPEEILNDVICGIKHRGFGNRQHLLPGSVRYASALAALNSLAETDPDVALRLRNSLNLVRGGFDHIYIDTSPAVAGMAGSMALFAADVIAIPLSGLRSVMGMCEVLQLIRSHCYARVQRGMELPQVVMYAPHVLADRMADPVGPFGVRNSDWYPLICDEFPEHFAQSVVGHSIKMSRAFAATVGIRAVDGIRRQEYQTLTRQVHAMAHDSALFNMGEYLLTDEGKEKILRLKDMVAGMIKAEEDSVEVRRIKFKAKK